MGFLHLWLESRARLIFLAPIKNGWRVLNFPIPVETSELVMIDVQTILDLHEKTVERWHNRSVDNCYDGVFHIICEQHSFNFLLWHEEDSARCPDAADTTIADVKRAIDKYNQQRNDAIEKIDDAISEMIVAHGVSPRTDAPLNTETPGSVMDRLSILSLRIYHLLEQYGREDASAEHRESVKQKIAICEIQKRDLAFALQTLLIDIASGAKRHRTYRQFKMYNDPAMNPFLYGSKEKAGLHMAS